MPIKPPTGFATRPEASKLFNRSQRQLERDLDVAYLAEDHEVLCRYKLMTKDGELRDAKDVTTKQVKQLQSEGMIPVWYVETSYLEQEYGRKGEPKPAKMRQNVAVTLQQVPHAAGSGPTGRRAAGGESQETPLLLSDAKFLRERILTLEQLNQQEKDRHDRIVEKLFAQMDVKGKQISAWDELAQGLTKGLATGQLTPRLLSPADDRPNDFRAGDDDSKSDHTKEVEVVEQKDKQDHRSKPFVSTEKRSRLDSKMDSSVTSGTAKNSPSSSPQANDASDPTTDKTDAAVGEGSAPSAVTKPSKKKRRRKNANKKSSRKQSGPKKRTRATAANSETKVSAVKAVAKSAPKPARKSGGLFSRFFRL